MTHANAAWTGMLSLEDAALASNHSRVLRKDFRAVAEAVRATAASYHQEDSSSR